jgi:hypothetical protein
VIVVALQRHERDPRLKTAVRAGDIGFSSCHNGLFSFHAPGGGRPDSPGGAAGGAFPMFTGSVGCGSGAAAPAGYRKGRFPAQGVCGPFDLRNVTEAPQRTESYPIPGRNPNSLEARPY